MPTTLLANELEVTAGKNLDAQPTPIFHALQATGPGAKSYQSGHRMCIHASADAGEEKNPLLAILPLPKKESTTSECVAALGIPIRVGGAPGTSAKADITIKCAVVGIMNSPSADGVPFVTKKAEAKWLATVDAGIKTGTGDNFTQPLQAVPVYAKTKGWTDVLPKAVDLVGTGLLMAETLALDCPVSLPVTQTVKSWMTMFGTLTPDAKPSWEGSVTLSGVELKAGTEYEAFVKARIKAKASVDGVYAFVNSFVNFDPNFSQKALLDSKVRYGYGIYLTGVSIKWQQPSAVSQPFVSNGTLINGWYWLRAPGARADWTFQKIDLNRVKTRLRLTLKPMVVTTFDGTPTLTQIGTSAGNLKVEHGKPAVFYINKAQIPANGKLAVSVTWLNTDMNKDGKPEHVGVNQQCLTVDYE